MKRNLGTRNKPATTGDFIGRAAEQQQFRATLRDLQRIQHLSDEQLDETLPYAQIFLVAAEGGMGKTSLLRRFEAIVKENNENAHATVIYINLEEYHQRTAIGRDIERFVMVIHDAVAKAGFESDLAPVRKERERRDAIHRKADDAAQQYNAMAALGGRMVELGSGGLIDREIAKEGVHAAAKFASDVKAAIRRKLSDDEWQLYDDPHPLTAKLLECLNTIAKPKRPLVLLLDTYEVADECDSWVRETLLPPTAPRLLWAIAGRANPEWFKGYDQAFGDAVRPVDLKTFNRGEIEQYLRQHNIEPTDELVTHLDGLSKGVPLALNAWVDLYRKGETLPEPTNDATTKREIVRRVTERFLRYCNDDRLYDHATRQQRHDLRDTIQSLLMLRRTDHATLAAIWQCTPLEAEQRLDRLNDDFSFILADRVTRTPHALVKEFVCEDVRQQPMRESVKQAITRLRDFTAQQMAQRERELHTSPSSQNLPKPNDAESQHLHELREIHQRNLHEVAKQIAKHTETNAPLHLLTQRDELQQKIAELDRQLKPPTNQPSDAPRRPLWDDEEWCEWMLDHLNALAWHDRKGEKVLKYAVPLLIEAIVFSRHVAASMIDILEPATTTWQKKHADNFEILKQGRKNDVWKTSTDELRAMISIFEQYQVTPLHKAINKLHTARLYREDKRLEQAIMLVDEATHLLPDDGGELKSAIGDEYAMIGSRYLWREGANDAIHSPEGLAVLRRAIQYRNDDAKAWYWLGGAEYKARNFHIAIKCWEHAISLDPTDTLPHNGLGNVYSGLKQYEAALASYQEAIRLDPTNATPHNGLGNVYYDLKKYDLALQSYHHAIELDPNDVGGYNNLGLVYEAQQEYDQAITAYRKAIDVDPTQAIPHRNLGDVYRALKQYDDAISSYRLAITHDSKDSDAYQAIGNIYSILGDLDKAETSYQQAVEINPQNHTTMMALARIARQQGDNEQWQAWIEQARPLYRDDDYYNLACLESIAGNVDEAVRLLALALEHDESDQTWAQQDPDFVFIRDDARYRALVGGNAE